VLAVGFTPTGNGYQAVPIDLTASYMKANKMMVMTASKSSKGFLSFEKGKTAPWRVRFFLKSF
jgi:hypothetical protein